MNVRGLRKTAANLEHEYQWLFERNPIAAQKQ
ncbi:Uncharacterised protein [Yersinia pekkanenii]|uniref:Uncharacterized protein n=1 Tax=Yersinia pekkanenii TaxID=1288385 RepID=A0A0T9PE37_9GAMM|nr:Uncharacterised protein [Yersinia pekkanenii]CRY66440.1 Uncharacterised protein [Yersinia pekkanenii]